jgi:diguanylate cyclase (GGDEF)-like protein
MGRYIHIAIVTVICVAVALLLYLLNTHSGELIQVSRAVLEDQQEKRLALVEIASAARESSLVMLSVQGEKNPAVRSELLLHFNDEIARLSSFVKQIRNYNFNVQQEQVVTELVALVAAAQPDLEFTTKLLNNNKNKQAAAVFISEVLPNYSLINSKVAELVNLIDSETHDKTQELRELQDSIQSYIWQLTVLLWSLLVILVVIGRIQARHRELMLERTIEKRNIEIVDANNRIKRLSEMDPLTDLANRRFFEQCLEEDIGRMKRANSPLSLLLIDIDHFKPFNDHYGNAVGDVAIKGIAKVIKKTIPRKTDLVSRYGGQAFMALLPATDAEGAFLLAEKVREKVQELGIKHEYSVIESVITVSIGVATLEGADLNKKDLIRRADDALGKAKAQGRNRSYVDRQS